MTAGTLFVQFLMDYLVYFIIAGVIVVGLIVANIVFAVLAHKKKKKAALPLPEQKDRPSDT